MLKEEAFDGAISSSPVEAGEWRVVHTAKVRGSAAGEAVGDAAGTGALVVAELAERALQVAMMVEFLQTTEHLLTTAANEVGDLGRA